MHALLHDCVALAAFGQLLLVTTHTYRGDIRNLSGVDSSAFYARLMGGGEDPPGYDVSMVGVVCAC